MAIIAQLANGSKLELNLTTAANTWVNVAGVTNFSIPSVTREEVDVTWLQSPNKETLPGTPDWGDMTGTIQLVPGSAVDTFMTNHNIAGTVMNIRTTLPTANVAAPDIKTYTGWIKTYDRKTNTHGSKMEADFAIRLNGETTITS